MLIRLRSGEPFGVAGSWEAWRGPEDPVEACTIATTGPDAATAPVHDRMPAILAPAGCGRWLGPSRGGVGQAPRRAARKRGLPSDHGSRGRGRKPAVLPRQQPPARGAGLQAAPATGCTIADFAGHPSHGTGAGPAPGPCRPQAVPPRWPLEGANHLGLEPLAIGALTLSRGAMSGEQLPQVRDDPVRPRIDRMVSPG